MKLAWSAVSVLRGEELRRKQSKYQSKSLAGKNITIACCQDRQLLVFVSSSTPPLPSALRTGLRARLSFVIFLPSPCSHSSLDPHLDHCSASCFFSAARSTPTLIPRPCSQLLTLKKDFRGFSFLLEPSMNVIHAPVTESHLGAPSYSSLIPST